MTDFIPLTGTNGNRLSIARHDIVAFGERIGRQGPNRGCFIEVRTSSTDESHYTVTQSYEDILLMMTATQPQVTRSDQ